MTGYVPRWQICCSLRTRLQLTALLLNTPLHCTINKNLVEVCECQCIRADFIGWIGLFLLFLPLTHGRDLFQVFFEGSAQNLPHMSSFNRLMGVGGLALIQVAGWVGRTEGLYLTRLSQKEHDTVCGMSQKNAVNTWHNNNFLQERIL